MAGASALAVGAGVGVGVAAGVGATTAGVLPLPSRNASTSFLTMRPWSPDPVTCSRLTPVSLAMLFARGDALTRLSSELAAAAGASAAGAATGVLGWPLAAAGAAAPPLAAASTACQSSPACPMTAMTPSIGTGPSLTAICRITPSTKASNSIVALSVSTSARVWPGSTWSPSFFNQPMILPSSIVSLIRGIRMTSAIGFAFCRLSELVNSRPNLQ